MKVMKFGGTSVGTAKSIMDDIPGVGPARRKALMRHFRSMEEIRAASVEELMQAPEIPQNVAEEIYRFFR